VNWKQPNIHIHHSVCTSKKDGQPENISHTASGDDVVINFLILAVYHKTWVQNLILVKMGKPFLNGVSGTFPCTYNPFWGKALMESFEVRCLIFNRFHRPTHRHPAPALPGTAVLL
jgi:hypothetical protein